MRIHETCLTPPHFCRQCSVTYIFIEIGHNLILKPVDKRLRVQDFLAAFKTYLALFALRSGCCLFDMYLFLFQFYDRKYTVWNIVLTGRYEINIQSYLNVATYMFKFIVHNWKIKLTFFGESFIFIVKILDGHQYKRQKSAVSFVSTSKGKMRST